ncbi:hypothetical protein JCM21900_000881, partial [Sporobolomyces salmonicolor]
SYDWLEHFWNDAELDDMARWFAKTVPRDRRRPPTYNPRPNSVPTWPGSSSSSASSSDPRPSGTPIVEGAVLEPKATTTTRRRSRLQPRRTRRTAAPSAE